MLRKRFQTTLLHLLEDALGKSTFRPFRNAVYSNYSKGFYVHAPKINNRDVKSTVKYVVRYTGRPAMAESRIINYDGEFVTFYYERHEDNQRVEETIHAYDFIKRLIIHIPDRYFNMVRYYGLYAKKHKFADKLFYMLSSTATKIRKQLSDWNHRILLYFKHEPLLCSCGHYFHFDYIVEKQYNSS